MEGRGGEVGQGPSAESQEKERGSGAGAAVAKGERADVYEGWRRVRGGVHIARAENRERVVAGANAAVTGASAPAAATAARLRGARGAAFGRQATAQRPEMLTWLGNWTPPRGWKLRLTHAPSLVEAKRAADGRYIWPLLARHPILRRAYPRATAARPHAFPFVAPISRTSADAVLWAACRAAFPRRSVVGQRLLSTLQVHARLWRLQLM